MAEDPKNTAAAATAIPVAAPDAPAGPPTAAELLNVDIAAGQKVVRAKGAKNIASGVVHVLATFNNTIVSVTDARGNVVGWSSAGKMGYKGSRKSTAYAAQLVSQDACRQAMGHGHVRVNGIRVNISSYQVQPGDIITIRESPRSKQLALRALDLTQAAMMPAWVTFDKDKLTGTMSRVPTKDEISPIVNEQLIVELYSR